MSFIIVPLVAIIASCLSLFSGFGLGTLLMPAFALFFPIHIAIAATATVHLSNNLFKIALVGKNADIRTVLLFAVPASIGAIAGATVLLMLYKVYPIGSYVLFGYTFFIEPVKLAVGILVVGFALFDLIPSLERLQFSRKFIPIGGLLSGFFGGLSGMQGALRAAFLTKSGLDKKAFIGTSTVCAVIVDIARILVYSSAIFAIHFVTIPKSMWNLVIVTTIAAFAGAFIGKRLMEKVTIKAVQMTVGVMLLVFGVWMSLGLNF
jgi:uncharacterized membrane protein YfcA